MTLGEGVPSNEGMKHGRPLKSRHFINIGLPSVKTVADRREHGAYYNKHW